mgnify:CR=1 FL=1
MNIEELTGKLNQKINKSFAKLLKQRKIDEKVKK